MFTNFPEGRSPWNLRQRSIDTAAWIIKVGTTGIETLDGKLRDCKLSHWLYPDGAHTYLRLVLENFILDLKTMWRYIK